MQQNKPIVSIITVVFNGVEFLEPTVLSVIDQQCDNYEYIIVDGGSTDGTLDIIRKYEKKIKVWISEPDNGLYDAMNKGLGMAQGDYVWFINAGDELYDPGTLCKIFDDDKGMYSDIYYGETLIIDQHRQPVGMRRQKTPEKLSWKSLKYGMVVSHQSIIVKRSVAPVYNLGYTCSADIDWVIRSLKQAKTIKNTHLILSRFMDGGRSKSTISPSLKERFRIMKENYGWLRTVLYHFVIAVRFLFFVIRHRRF